jgi:acyl-CoA thioester hydrolase
MPWERRHPLRFGDTDQLGHVTASAYLMLFEETRTAWLAEAFGVRLPIYVVARQEIDYLREVLLDDGPVSLTVEVTRIGRSSFDIAETLAAAGGDVRARSRATLVLWDLEARRPRPITDGERAALETT